MEKNNENSSEQEQLRASAEYEDKSFSNDYSESKSPPAFNINAQVSQQKSKKDGDSGEKEVLDSANQQLLFANAGDNPIDEASGSTGLGDSNNGIGGGVGAPIQKKVSNDSAANNTSTSPTEAYIPPSVNVHKESSQATEMGAKAFAQGSDIHFAPGQFKPETQSGKQLIGHELGHVVQQKEGRVKPSFQQKGMPVNNDVKLESEADNFGKAYASGNEDTVSQLKTDLPAQPFNINPIQRVVEPGGASSALPFNPQKDNVTTTPVTTGPVTDTSPQTTPDQDVNFTEYAANIMLVNATLERRLFKESLGRVLFNGQLTQVLHLVTESGLTALMNSYWAQIREEVRTGPFDFDTTGAEARQSLQNESASQERFFYVSTNAAGLQEKLIKQFAYTSSQNFRQLELLAKVYKGSFNATHISNELYNSMYGGVFGWGTDEDRAFAALSGLSSLEVVIVKKAYKALYDRNLESDLQDEMDSGADNDRWNALLSGDAAKDAAAALHNAMHSGWSGMGLGTDESAIMSTLRNKTPEQVQAIKDAYKELYGSNLEDDFKSELGGHDALRADALTESNTNKADAIAIDQAMHETFMGIDFGTDEAGIEQVYTDIRNDVTSAPENSTMTTAQINEAVLNRNQQVEGEYNSNYSVDGENSSSLRNAFDNEMQEDGGYNNLMNAYADNDLTGIDASKIQVESEGIMYADDSNINDALENQYKRAHSELMRDVWPIFQLQISQRTSDPYEQKALRREYMAIIHDQAIVLAEQYMSDLGSTYEANTGSASFEYDVAFNTSGVGSRKSSDLIAGNGYLSPAQQIWHAVNRDGTDEDAVKQAIQGKTLTELAAIDTEFQTLSGGRSLRDVLLNSHFLGIHELSGRDWYDVQLMLDHGDPESADAEMAYTEDRVQTEKDNAGWLEFRTGAQVEAMDRSLEYMQEQHAILNNPNATPEQIALAQSLFGNSADNVSFSIGSYREQADAVASTATTIAAVVVGVVLAIASWGSMSAVSVALISSAVASATSMAGKFLLSGAAYGSDAFATDLGMAALDMITARLTMGMGDELLDSVPLLKSMANDRGAVSRLVAHGIAEGYESIPGGFASSLAGEIVNEQTWDSNNPGASILFQSLVNTAIGAGQSFAMGIIGQGVEDFRNRSTTTDPNANSGVDNTEVEEVDISDNQTPQEHDSVGPESTTTTTNNEVEIKSVVPDLSTSSTTASEATAWDDPAITFDEFKAQYIKQIPNTSLSHDELLLRYMRGQRLHPDTGRLRKVGPDRSYRLDDTNNYDGVEAFRDTFDANREMDPDLTGQLYNYYDQQQWGKMEELGNSMGIKWPPGFGGFNTQFDQVIPVGTKYDRYSGTRGLDEEGNLKLTGSNFSPSDHGSIPFPDRALDLKEGEYDLHIEIEIKKELNFTAETADIIPYFGQPGMGKQSRWVMPNAPDSPYPYSLTELANMGFIKITILGSPSGAYTHLIGTTIP